MSAERVFYSWQSDLPNRTNRGFIADALERAVKAIRSDKTIEVEPVIDRDTLNVPGSPDISHTIFSKIDEARAVVCDISIINSMQKGRLTPNPNVLVELGYAMKALGFARVLMVANTSFGEVESLPFDLGRKRIITYEAAEDEQGLAEKRRALASVFERALRDILLIDGHETDASRVSAAASAVEAVENSAPNQTLAVRRFLAWLCAELDRIAPEWLPDTEDEDALFTGKLEETEPVAIAFAKVVQVVAAIDSFEAVREVYRWFGSLQDRYETPRGWAGRYTQTRLNYYKFIGHELFVMLFSFLLKEDRLSTVSRLLHEEVWGDNTPSGGGIHDMEWMAEGFLQGMDNMHRAELLERRHTQGELGMLCPLVQLMDADVFFSIRSQTREESGVWAAWSALRIDDPPRFLVKAQNTMYAQELVKALDAGSVDRLKHRLSGCLDRLTPFHSIRFNPVGMSHVQEIGTR